MTINRPRARFAVPGAVLGTEDTLGGTDGYLFLEKQKWNENRVGVGVVGGTHL